MGKHKRKHKRLERRIARLEAIIDDRDWSTTTEPSTRIVGPSLPTPTDYSGPGWHDGDDWNPHRSHL